MRFWTTIIGYLLYSANECGYITVKYSSIPLVWHGFTGYLVYDLTHGVLVMAAKAIAT